MVKEEKIKAVEELKNAIEKHSVIGFIDLHKLPSKQLHEIKKQLRGSAIVKVVKKSILMHAIEGNQKLSAIEKMIPSQPSIIMTDTEPFKLYMSIDRMKSPAFAKEGSIAEEEIFVTAGPTGLMPGPVISEFAKVGLVGGVEEGKIAIKRDKVVAKKGDVISKDLASVLRKLKIQPIKVGINVVGIYANGVVYGKDVLSLVGENYLNKIKEAFNQALNLSVAISYPTKENVVRLFAKAYQQAKAIENKIGGS